MAIDHAKFLARFVDEAREHCSRLSEGLLALEQSPGDGGAIDTLFRSAHTIKGASRMMKLAGVTELAHRIEDVLDAVRAGRLALTQGVTNALFKGVDALQVMLDKIAGGEPRPEPPAALCQELSQIATPLSAPPPTNHPAPADAAPAPVASADSSEVAAQVHDTLPADSAARLLLASGRSAEYLRINAEKLDDLIRLMGEIVSEQGRVRKQVGRFRELERAAAYHAAEVARHLGSFAGDSDQVLEAGAALQQDFRQSMRALQDTSLMLDHLVSDLLEISLKMRMQPLATVFDPLRRMARDLARDQGKEIEFVVEGGDTELDRKIIDRIGDSLLHMIRNSLDHGIGLTAERIAAGKSPKGTITLAACYDSGCVTITLSDDGRGIDVDKIRERALARRLLDADTLAAMSRAELLNLIFWPGFSTSPIITDLSGRGVGMDVVRKCIVDELQGSISIDTRAGAGTTFLLRLPLNLAVFPLFLVAIGGRSCALPATSLAEMVMVHRGEIIEILNRRAIRLREQIIPVEDLSAILGLPRAPSDATDDVMIVVVRDGEEKLGLLVDEILGREEMVVKPLPAHLQGLRLVSGVTIGERNSIINVLHVPELFRQAREIAEPERMIQETREDRAPMVLVVDDSINTREIEKSILEAYGYMVETAEDGAEALQKSHEVLYDLVITDVEMPKLDGFSLTEKLRADERYRNVPIIIVTSRQKDEDKKRGILVGANAYIVKGAFDQSNLIETVRSLIG